MIAGADAAIPSGAMRAPTPAAQPAPTPVVFDDEVAPAGCGCGPRAGGAPCGCEECGGCGGCGGCGCGGGRQGVHTPYDGGCCSCGGCDCQPCCDECCDECCGLLNDCCCHEPWIRFRGEALALERSEGDSHVNFGGGLTQDHFDFTYDIGVRLAAEIRFGCDCSAEAVYTGMQRWQDDIISLNDAGGLIATSNYVSELQEGEINFWRPVRWRTHRLSGALMIGARYFGLHEEFTFGQLAPPADITIEVDNHLALGQIGWMVNGNLGNGISVRWDGKAAAGANIVQRDVVQLAPVAVADFDNDDDVAFLGDTTAVISYQATRRISVYAGYYLLWADGLALAPEQFAIPFVPTAAIDTNGFVFFQGFVAGGEVTW
jgi:hypothetical protein